MRYACCSEAHLCHREERPAAQNINKHQQQKPACQQRTLLQLQHTGVVLGIMMVELKALRVPRCVAGSTILSMLLRQMPQMQQQAQNCRPR